MTVEQALHAATVAPAWLAGDERRRGRLLPGFLADLVVLDRDPVAVPPDELAEVAGRRDDGRRPLGAQPAALGLSVGETMFPPRAPFFSCDADDACLASRPAKPASGRDGSCAAPGRGQGPRAGIGRRGAIRRSGTGRLPRCTGSSPCSQSSSRRSSRARPPSAGSTARPRVTFFGDSVAAALAYEKKARTLLAKGLDLQFDAKVCRRLAETGCPYKGERPSSVLSLVEKPRDRSAPSS